MPPPAAADGVADGALDVEVERVAELVGLGLVRALVADAGALDLVRPSLSLASLLEEVATERCWPMRRRPLGVSSSCPSWLSIRPGVLELRASSASRSRLRAASSPSSSRARSMSTSASAPGLRRAPQQVLELVDVAELAHHAGRLGEAQRVLAREVVAAVPTHLREQLAQVAAELVDLPAQVHVLQQLFGQALELGPLLGRHRVEHRLHGGHALSHHLEQLVEGLRVLGEEVAVAAHELLEGGLGVLAAFALLEQLVEVGQHVLHALHVLGTRRRTWHPTSA